MPPKEPRDIPTHPALSRPYKSHTLPELSQQALDIICAEHRHVTRLKSLLTYFLGDESFVATEKMETEHVPSYLRDAQAQLATLEQEEKAYEERHRAAEEEQQRTQTTAADDEDVEMINGNASDQAAEGASPIPKVEHHSPPGGFTDGAAETGPSNTQSESHRMTTRSSQNPVNVEEEARVERLAKMHDIRELLDSTSPWFYAPERDENTRNFGLNHQEADETRQLLLLAVQKEDEFIRGLENVRKGLLRAEKMRQDVWEWCRADGAPEQSDGEDYVDLDRWGLEEGDLVKGVEEEEEEDTRGKKTTRGGRRN